MTADIDTPGAALGDDLSALSWVQAELRRSLDLANKALRRYLKEREQRGDLDSVDPGVLRQARSQLHQCVGVLEMVGLGPAAELPRAAEAALQRLSARPKLITPQAVDVLERGSFALLDFIDRRLAGKQVSPLALFPQYAALQELAGALRVHPADLWPVAWAWREMPAEAGLLPPVEGTDVTAQFESDLLSLMRGAPPSVTARLGETCATLAMAALGRAGTADTGAPHARQATLWQLAAGFFEAQADGLLKPDAYSKRLGSKLLSQLRAGPEAEPSERLAHDLLFFCAQSQVDAGHVPGPRLAAVLQAWRLGPEHRTDYDHARLGRFDPAVVAQARKRVATAKDLWSAVAAGEAGRAEGLSEQFTLVSDSLARLYPEGAVLGRALQVAAAHTLAAGPQLPAELAMEVATALLYIDASIEDGDFDLPDAGERVQRLAQRIDAVRQSRDPGALELWMEALYRRVSDRQTMGSVVAELRAALSEIERHIDQYFRDPSQREVLMPVPAQLQSMRGVLSVLGLEQASQAVLRMRDDVDALASTEVDPLRVQHSGAFDRLADNLGALSFLIDMVSVQPQMAKSLFRFDPDTGSLSAVVARTERPTGFDEAQAAPATDALAVTLDFDRMVRQARAGHRESQSPQPLELGVQGLPLLDLPPEPDAPAPAPAAPAAAPVAAGSGLEDDPEMREIFLEEAAEVLTGADEALAQLEAQHDDRDAMTTVRRAFHTLKGSARMVGLSALGEAAWACEQLYNARLAEHAGADADLRGFTADALRAFELWVEALGAGDAEGHGPQPIVQAAEALRSERRRLPIAGVTLAEVAAREARATQPGGIDTAADTLSGPVSVDAIGDTLLPPDVSEGGAELTIPGAFDPLPDLLSPAPPPRPPAPADADAGAEAVAEAGTEPASEGQAEALLPAADSSELSADEVDRLAELLRARVPGLPEPAALELRSDLPALDLPALDIAGLDAEPAAPTPTPAPEPAPAPAADAGAVLPPASGLADLPTMVLPPAPPPPPPADLALDLDLDAAAEPAAVPASETATAPEAPATMAAPAPAEGEAEGWRQIGPLRIGVQLFNIYLNEADDLSRRLIAELADWAGGPLRPPTAEAVVLAHSLAGSSATVGYTDLSQLARALEHGLERLQARGSAAADEVALAGRAADEVQRLLHLFAAGFLQAPEPTVLAAVQAMGLAAAEPADAAADAAGPTPLGRAALMPYTALAALEAVGTAGAADAAGATATPGFDEEIDLVDAVDEELWQVFWDEAQELLPRLHAGLRDWAAHPGDSAPASACMRSLHNFKGSARLAGAMRLGELAHRLESMVERLAAQPAPAPAEIEALAGHADTLQARLDALRAPAAADAAGPESGLADLAPAAAPATAAAPVGTVSASPAAAPAAAAPAGELPAIDWQRFGAAREAAPAEAVLPAAAAAAGSVRVRIPLLDRLVNQAGEVAIARARIDADVGQFKTALADLNDNLERLRAQLRDIELQAETQIETRKEAARQANQSFDPLEMDRFTRFQELTRMMAESVADVATVQRGLQRTLQSTEDALAHQGRMTRDMQDDLLRTRMVEFDGLSERLYRVVRQAAKETAKPVRLDIRGGKVEIDRGVLDRMTPAFEHLLRNSVVHGIEPADERTRAGKDATGTVTLSVTQTGNEVAVEVRDDGAGLNLPRILARAQAMGLVGPEARPDDADLANLIFEPGFTTAENLTGLAGRGVGMDVVRTEVNAMGGRIETASAPGQGTSFRLLLPLTTAVTQVVMLRCGERAYAVPSSLVEMVRRVPADEIVQAHRSGNFTEAGQALPFFWLDGLLAGAALSTADTGGTWPVVVIRSAQQRVVLQVDEVLGNQDVVVKNLGPQLARVPGLVGMTLLPSGLPALIYNPVALATRHGETARHAALAALAGQRVPTSAVAEEQAPLAPLVLVVDDSLTVRRITQRLLEREGYRVALAKDGIEGMEKLALDKPAVLLTDIEMPRMDGFDLVRTMRQNPGLADLPVIMITSRIAQKHRDYAAELGVDHYLGKPYVEDELLQLVARHARRAQAALPA